MQPIGNAAFFPNIIDVNEDGFIDVLLICSTPIHFCWYENRVLSTQSFTKFQATVVPNPARDKIHITTNQTIDKLELFTVLGQKLVVDGSRSTEQTLNLEQFQPGLYFVSIYSGSEKQVVKVVKK